MKTNRELFEQVQAKFRGRHNDKSTVGKYYDRIKVPGGCAVGCLLSREDRKYLQDTCDKGELPYSIGDILKNEEVLGISNLREYSAFALRMLQSMHDNSKNVGHFKERINSALTTGLATTYGFSDLYLDEELGNDGI